MTLSWSFYAFDYPRFVKGAFDPHLGVSKLKHFLGGPESKCPDRKLLTAENLALLGKGEFNYNKLPKKHWRLLDAYVRVYVRDVLASEPLAATATGSDKWQHLLRFYLDRNGKDTTVFNALAEGGRRYDVVPEKANWLTGISNMLYKRPERYLILEGEELDKFCRHLQVLFYVNAWDWPTYLPAQELLRPLALEPFLTAREKGQAVFAVLGEAKAQPMQAPTTVPEPELVEIPVVQEAVTEELVAKPAKRRPKAPKRGKKLADVA